MAFSTLNNRITFIREHLQLSKSELAAYLEVPEKLVKKAEEHPENIPASFLHAMLHKLDISTDWLLTGEGSMFVTFKNDLILNAGEPVIAEQYFSLKEEALEDRIRELEKNIINEANIPLQHIRALFAQLLQLSAQPQTSGITFNKLEELSYPDKALYCKELEKQFKSAREEFLNHFKQLYQNINSGKFRQSEFKNEN